MHSCKTTSEEAHRVLVMHSLSQFPYNPNRGVLTTTKQCVCLIQLLQLKEVGVITADCNSSDSYLPQLEEVAARLEVLDAINNSKRDIRSIPNVASYSNKVHYCAWYNDRILDNCRNASDYNSAYREAFQPICSGSCLGLPHNSTSLCSIII